MTQDVSLFSIAAALLRRRRTLVAIVSAGLAVTVVLALLRPPLFTSSFSFVPEASQSTSRNPLASLAGQFGVSLGGTAAMAQSPQFYADLLTTRALLVPILLDTVSPSSSAGPRQRLLDYLGITEPDQALALDRGLRVLREGMVSSSVALRTTGVVTVRVRTRSAAVSRQVAERLIRALNEFNLRTRQSDAAEERRFTEERLAAANASLETAETAVQRFLSTNRQFAGSPELAFEHDRLQRAVALRQQVAVGLAQQLEEVRIREVRDTPVITVIERPVDPASPDPRGRTLLLIVGLLVSVFAAAGICLALEYVARARDAGAPGLSELSHELARWKTAASEPTPPS